MAEPSAGADKPYNIYEVELPGGTIVEIEAQDQPDDSMVKEAMIQSLPRYDFSAGIEQARKGAGSESDIFSLTSKSSKWFKDSKIGEEYQDPLSGKKIIKVSDNEYISPQYEDDVVKAAQSGATGAFVRAGVMSAPQAVGATRAMGASLPLAQAVSRFGPLGRAAGIAIPVAAAATGAIATGLVEDQIVQAAAPEVTQQLARDRAQQPLASFLGTQAGSFATGGVGLGKDLLGRSIGAATGGGIQAAEELANAPEGQILPEDGVGRIAIGAGLGAAQNKLNTFGEEIAEGAAQGRIAQGLKTLALPKKETKAVTTAVSQASAKKSDTVSSFEAANALALNPNPTSAFQEAAAQAAKQGAVVGRQAVQEQAALARNVQVEPVVQPAITPERINESVGLNQVVAPVAVTPENSVIASPPPRIEGISPSALDSASVMMENQRIAEPNSTPQDIALRADLQAQGITPADQSAGAIEAGILRQQEIDDMAAAQNAVNQALEINPEFPPAQSAEGSLLGESVESGLPPQAINAGINASAAAEPIVGAVIGYQFGDTEEEKRKNAAIGAMIGLGTATSWRTYKALKTSNPALANAVVSQVKTPLAPPETKVTVTNIPVEGRPDIPPYQHLTVEVPGEAPFYGSYDDAVKAGLTFAKPPENSPDGVYAAGQLNESAYQKTDPGTTAYEQWTRGPDWGDAPQPVTDRVQADIAGAGLPPVVRNEGVSPILSRSAPIEAIKNSFGEIAVNVQEDSPRMWKILNDFDFQSNKALALASDQAAPMLTLRKELDPEVFKQLNIAYLNENWPEIERIANSLPEDVGNRIIQGFQSGFDTATMVADRMVAQGLMDAGQRREGYLPKSVGDYDGLRASMGREELNVLTAAEKAYQESLGVPQLTDIQRQDVLTRLIRDSRTGGGGKGYLKPRTIKAIDENMANFYEPFDVAMARYLKSASKDLTEDIYFGKIKNGGNKEIAEQIFGSDVANGGIITKELMQEWRAGRITDQQLERLLYNFSARWKGQQAAQSFVASITQPISNAVSLFTMGDLSSTIPQFADSLMNLGRYGLLKGTEGNASVVAAMLKGKNASSFMDGGPVRMSDVYLNENRHADILDFAVEGGAQRGSLNRAGRKFNEKLSRYTGKVLDKTIGWADKKAKEMTLNSAWERMSKVFRQGSSGIGPSDSLSGFRALNEKYAPAFRDEWPQIVDDIANGRLTEGAKQVLFMELAGVQPLGMSQRSPLYNTIPEARFAFILKSFMFKQLNTIRNDGYNNLKRGVDAWKGGDHKEGWRLFRKGVQNLILIGMVAAAQNASVQYVRDQLMGRPTSPDDVALGGIMQLFGVSRYNLQQMKEGNFNQAAADFAFPMFGILKNLTKDAGTIGQYVLDTPDNTARTPEDLFKQLEGTQYVPGLGKEIYNWFGRGREKINQRILEEGTSKEQPSTLEALGFGEP